MHGCFSHNHVIKVKRQPQLHSAWMHYAITKRNDTYTISQNVKKECGPKKPG